MEYFSLLIILAFYTTYELVEFIIFIFEITCCKDCEYE